MQLFYPGNDGKYINIGETAAELVVEGANSFPTRVPVPNGGVYFGLRGPEETFVCDEETTATSAFYNGEVRYGTAAPFGTENSLGTPVTAVVEPDYDRDEYGDETQDGCPKGVEYQSACPKVTLRLSAKSRDRAIVVWVRTSTSGAIVKIFGQVGWNFKPRAQRPRPKVRMIVSLSGGGKFIDPRVKGRFRVPLPKLVLRRLSRLAPDESLTAKIAARSTDLAGRVETKRIRVRLKGQGNPLP
ncbi:MAG TPA: hypothetical protein VN752_11100 [Solirubrobacterales bacterium]|nr:hypothetical protein [Solirubrobacterales bacterium]